MYPKRSVIIVLYCVFCDICSSTKIPLSSEDQHQPGTQESTPGCWLGSEFYHLEDIWHPTLEPIGELVCVVCQCIPIVRKGVLDMLGKVTCRNIKTECPEAQCDDAVLLPGQCCKTCPGQEFTSLLTGVSEVTSIDTRRTARGKFTLQKQSLYYTIQLSRYFSPRQLLITDNSGVTLYERTFPDHVFEDVICGTWTHLPSIYLRYLVDGQLNIILTTDLYIKGEIAGKIIPKHGPDKEVFSSLLVPQRLSGGGGLALLTYDVYQDYVNIEIQIKGSTLEEKNIISTVEIEKYGKTLYKKSIDILADDGKDIDIKWGPLSASDIKHLGRGNLRVLLYDAFGDITHSGGILPSPSCSILYSILTTISEESSVQTPPAGIAFVKLNFDGTMQYSVAATSPSHIKINSAILGYSYKGKDRTLCTVTVPASAKFNQQTFIQFNGTCKEKANAREVALLRQKQVKATIEFDGTPPMYNTGPIEKLLLSNEFPKRGITPLMLTSAECGSTSTNAGLVWIYLDPLCKIQYHVTIGTPEHGHKAIITYQEELFELEEFIGKTSEGTVTSPSTQLLEGFNGGDVILVVISDKQPKCQISSKVSLVNDCVERKHKWSTGYSILDDGNKEEISPSYTADWKYHCEVKDEFGTNRYKDGDTWRDTQKACSTCSCNRGKHECHDVMCVPVTCSDPVMLEGECCPQCVDRLFSSRTCYFDGDKRHHYQGTHWHPYVPPFGYQRCAVCTCVSPGSKNEINCSRSPCPELTCPKQTAIRVRESDCCLQCTDQGVNINTMLTSSSAIVHDQAPDDKSCIFKNNRYNDGERWNPSIAHLGKVKCVTCRCKGGKTQCRRQKCPSLNCKKRYRVRRSDSCCPVCLDSRKNRRKGRRRRDRNKNINRQL